ncbi:hypothetical protein ACSTS3_01960 [Aquimarina muelleri]|uniref:hypothetical protein n=1 Tax=Aquimarina muelleri TaxID=279356 RepID=UPI003F68270B
METGMIVILIILIVICTLPFILINGSTKKKEKQLKKALEISITEDNGILTDYVINYNFALGLDSNAKQIYYYKKTLEAEYLQKINLKNIATCEIKKDTKQIRNGKLNYERIQSIALVFTFKKNNLIDQFKVYDYDDSPQLSGELALADTWKKKVIDLLTKDSTNLKDPKIEKTSLKFA